MSSSLSEVAQAHQPLRCYFLQTSNQFSRFPVRHPQSQVSAILKMTHLKFQQKQHMARFKTSNEDENDERIREFRQNHETHLTGRRNLKEIANNNNGKFIQNTSNRLRCSQLLNNINNIESYARTTTNANSRKNYHSCLQKCRMVTQNYDELKNQIISKIKIKRSQRMQMKLNKSSRKNPHDHNKNEGLIGLVVVENQKQNYANLQRAEALTQHNKHKVKSRHRSLSDSTKKGRRYMEMSVSQFMEEKQTDISVGISKKFEEYQKQLNQRTLTKTIQQIECKQLSQIAYALHINTSREQTKKKRLTLPYF